MREDTELAEVSLAPRTRTLPPLLTNAELAS